MLLKNRFRKGPFITFRAGSRRAAERAGAAERARARIPGLPDLCGCGRMLFADPPPAFLPPSGR